MGKIAPGKNHGFKLAFPKLVSLKLKLWSNKLLRLFQFSGSCQAQYYLAHRVLGKEGRFPVFTHCTEASAELVPISSGEKLKGTRPGWDIHPSCCLGCFAYRSTLCFNFQEFHFELWSPIGTEKASVMFWLLTYLPKTLIDHPLFSSHPSLG